MIKHARRHPCAAKAARFALIVTLAAVLSGQLARAAGTTIWQNEADFVRIETPEGAPTPAISALPPLSTDAVRAVLSAVQVSGDGGTQPFLSESQIGLLAEPVARALRSAAPGQDVTFAVHYSGSIMSIVGPPKMTAGRIFVDGEALGLIIGMVQETYLRNIVALDSSLIRTGSRSSAQMTAWHIVPGGAVSLAQSGRTDWARISPVAWTGTYGMPLPPTPAAAPAPMPMAAGPTPMAAGPTPMAAAPMAMPPAPPVADNSFTALGAAWAAAWGAGNLEGVMALYAPDPTFLSGEGERWSGADSLRQHFAEALAKYRGDLHLHPVRSGWSGDLAYDSGSYDETITTLAGNHAPMMLHGNYLFLLQRMPGGGWKILEQSWSGMMPDK